MKRMYSLLVATVIMCTVAMFSCKQNQDTNGQGKVPGVVLKFGSDVKCAKLDGSEILSEAEVAEGDEVVLSPVSIDSGKGVKAWYANDKELPQSAKGRFKYKVSKSNAQDEGGKNVITFRFDIIDVTKTILKLGEGVTCKDASTGIGKDNGDVIKEGEKLELTAFLSEKKVCEGWYVNDVKLPSSETPVFLYDVKVSHSVVDGDTGVISFSFKETPIVPLVMNFDSKIRAVNQVQKGVFPGDEVSGADVITFTANVEDGKTVEAWYVGNTKQENSAKREFVYTPKVGDSTEAGGKRVIEIKVEKRDSSKLKIVFDKKIYTTSGIETGSEVSEGQFIEFNSSLSSNSYAPTWYVNTEKQKPQSLGGDPYYDNFNQTFKYVVNAKDAKEEGGEKKILIDYKIPDGKKKLKLIFEEDKLNPKASRVVVIVPGKGQIHSGDEVTVGMDLGIQANYGETTGYQTEAIDSWYINDKKVGYPKIVVNPTIYPVATSSFAYIYIVSEEDADKDGNINLRYETHERQEIRITADESIRIFSGGTQAPSPVDSGSSIKEDTLLRFQKDPESDEYFDGNFYFNGKKWESILSSDSYLLNKRDAVFNGVEYELKVTTKTRKANEIKVEYDDPGLTVQNRSKQKIPSGTSIKEGTTLNFFYKVQDPNKVVIGFMTDGTDVSHQLARNGNTDKVEGASLQVDLKWCAKEGDEYVFRPRFVLDDKKMVTIKLGQNLTCTNRDTNATVTDGMKVPEGTTLGLKANTTKELSKWVIGHKTIFAGRTLLPNPAVWCVSRAWSQKENGEYSAHLSFEEK